MPLIPACVFVGARQEGVEKVMAVCPVPSAEASVASSPDRSWRDGFRLNIHSPCSSGVIAPTRQKCAPQAIAWDAAGVVYHRILACWLSAPRCPDDAMPRQEITLCSPNPPRSSSSAGTVLERVTRPVRRHARHSRWLPIIRLPKPCRAYRPADGACVLAVAYSHHSLSAPFFRRFHRLAVENGDARTGVPSHLLTHFGTQLVMHLLPDARLTPAAKVTINRIPGRKVVRQHPPTIATTEHKENGVDNFSAWVGGGTPTAFDRGTSGSSRAHSASLRSPG